MWSKMLGMVGDVRNGMQDFGGGIWDKSIGAVTGMEFSDRPPQQGMIPMQQPQPMVMQPPVMPASVNGGGTPFSNYMQQQQLAREKEQQMKKMMMLQNMRGY